MTENQLSERGKRKPYAPPVVERVVLDPIKEMLVACPEALGGKLAFPACSNNFS